MGLQKLQLNIQITMDIKYNKYTNYNGHKKLQI